MAETRTTIAAAIGVDDLTLKVTSATGVSAGMAAKLDDEFIREVLSVDGTTVKVGGRGWDGTAGVRHDILAPITFFTKSGTSVTCSTTSIASTTSNFSLSANRSSAVTAR